MKKITPNECIRQLRSVSGLNRSDFAELTGLNPCNVSQIENDIWIPGYKAFSSIVEKAGGSVRVIAELDGKRSEVDIS